MDKEQTMLKTKYTPGSEIESVEYLLEYYNDQTTNLMIFVCNERGERELIPLKTIVETWNVLKTQENISAHRLYYANLNKEYNE